jgi:hypothetical protein
LAVSHIIVSGYGRSGTTLLYVMLASTVQGYRFYEAETDALAVVSDEPKITKRPLDLFRAAAIRQAIPDALWIVMIRDPRSVLCSRLADVGGGYRISWDTAPRTAEPNDIPAPGLVARDRAIDWLKAPVIVRYEHLIRDPNAVQDRLRILFGFRMEGRFSGFHTKPVAETFETLMGRARPVDKRRLSPWRWQPERIIQQFEEAPELFDILVKRGYERDRKWFDQLKERTA